MKCQEARANHYPFNPDVVAPSNNKRWKTRKKPITGSSESTDMAKGG
jgi:hypothetical protein